MSSRHGAARHNSNQARQSRRADSSTATTSSATAVGVTDVEAAAKEIARAHEHKDTAKRDALYERCVDEAEARGGIARDEDGENRNMNNENDTFTQSDLMGLGIASEITELLRLCQDLISAHLFQVVQVDSDICYRVRPLDVAHRLATLDARELLVYNHIDQAGRAGIWTKTLKARTNLHQTVMTRVLKSLEGQKFIKQTKLVKHPGRKIYMLYDLDPGDEATGGPWYSDGELDLDFVDSIAAFVVDYIKRQSWREGPKFIPGITSGLNAHGISNEKAGKALANPTKKSTAAERAAITAAAGTDSRNRTAAGTADKSDNQKLLPESPLLLAKPAYPHLSNAYNHEIDFTKDSRFYGPALSHRGRILVPHEPGYTGYPGASEILNIIDSTGIVKGKNLTESDLRLLLDMLVYDRKLERIGKKRIFKDRRQQADYGSDDDDDDEESDQSFEQEEEETEKKPESLARGTKRSRADQSEKALRRPSKRNKATPLRTDITTPKYAMEDMYRAVRWPSITGIINPPMDDNTDNNSEIDQGPGNGWTEAPCSKCPVFRLCEEGGPVDARSCAYFEDWLKF